MTDTDNTVGITKETSKVILNGNLFEQYYNPKEEETGYVGLSTDNTEIIKRPFIDDDFIKYKPIDDDLLQKGAVILPIEPKEYGTDEKLEEEINLFIKKWLDVSEDFQQKATWYTMLSWIMERQHTIPYLRALGDYGTGKTRFLDVVGGLCYKPMSIGGAVTSAPIYRVIDLWRGTAIFDEFTLGKSDETQDIVQILNCGFQRGKPVLRCDDGGNYNKVKAFDPFGAKILATRSKFKDGALESRCITEVMRMTTRKDIPIDFDEEFYESRMDIQNKLLMYRFRNWNKAIIKTDLKIDYGNIMPRVKQSLMPFTALFRTDADRLKKFVEYMQMRNKEIIEENSQSLDGQMFNYYIDLLEKHQEMVATQEDYKEPTITAGDIRNALINDGWKEDSIKTSFIGKHLHALGFQSKVKKIDGKPIRTLFIDDELLKSLRSRYVVTAVTEVTDICEDKKTCNQRRL